PRLLALDAVDALPEDLRGALGAPDPVRRLRLGPVLLPARVEQLHAALVLEDDRVVVEDVTELLAGSALPAAQADALDRRLVLHAQGHVVDALAGLLDDVVAGEPGEVQPVAQLVRHVVPVLLAVYMPQPVGVVEALQRRDLAAVPAVDALHPLAFG